jgi:hypothetical protein
VRGSVHGLAIDIALRISALPGLISFLAHRFAAIILQQSAPGARNSGHRALETKE